jgi:hypothetical protein
MQIISIGLMLAAVVATLHAKGSKSALRAVQGAIVLIGTIPSHAAPPPLLATMVGCLLLCLVIALLKAPLGLAGDRVNWPLVALMLCVGVNGLRGLSGQIGEYNVLVGVSLALLAAVFPIAAREFGILRPLSPLAFLLPVHLVLAAAEQSIPSMTFWPRGTWMDLMDNRPQQLLPELLAGRSMSVTGHPILLGTLASAGILVALELYRARRKAHYLLFVGAGFGALAFSGTRSAVFACAVCLVLSYVLNRKKASQILLWSAILGGVVVAFQTSLLSEIFNDGITSGVSYTHRTDVLSSVTDMYRRASDFERVFGVGDGHTAKVFQTVIGTRDDLLFFDNQLVRLFAVSGIVSLVLLAAALVLGLSRADRLSAMLLTFSVIMFFSFDSVTWIAGAALFVLGASGPRNESQPRHFSSILPPPRRVARRATTGATA